MAVGRLGRGMGLLSLALTLLVALVSTEMDFNGDKTTFARYPKWNICSDTYGASFSLDFRTATPEGLILYMDDGGLSDFLEVSYRHKKLRLLVHTAHEEASRVKIELKLKHVLDDGKWHQLAISRLKNKITLTLDDVTESKPISGSDVTLGSALRNSDLFIGGIPSELQENPSKTSHHKVLGKSHFKGSIRNVIYGNCTCKRERVVPVEVTGVTEDKTGGCESDNPCQPNCVCLTTNDGHKCDCTSQECQKGK